MMQIGDDDDHIIIISKQTSDIQPYSFKQHTKNERKCKKLCKLNMRKQKNYIANVHTHTKKYPKRLLD